MVWHGWSSPGAGSGIVGPDVSGGPIAHRAIEPPWCRPRVYSGWRSYATGPSTLAHCRTGAVFGCTRNPAIHDGT